MLSNENLYKKYKLEGLLDSKKLYQEKHQDIELESTLAKTFKKQFKISEDEYDSYVEKFSEEIQKIKSKYTEERKKGFKSIVKFYDWYKQQDQVCAYCHISQDELDELFTKNDRKLPLNDAIKRSSGTLEIERKDSNKEYSEDNCILACPLCNNAKSNLIDEKSWKELFAPQMRKYYKNLLKRDLKYNS